MSKRNAMRTLYGIFVLAFIEVYNFLHSVVTAWRKRERVILERHY
jgi:hypothetical protein